MEKLQTHMVVLLTCQHFNGGTKNETQFGEGEGRGVQFEYTEALK